MQAVMETAFDAVYLILVITVGIIMMVRARHRQYRLFGLMAVVLGCGDAFHLVPRAYALCTDGLAAHTAALGFGKLITSITMTAFYVILYHIWRQRYRIWGGRPLTVCVYLLAAVRVALCLFPQNQWLSAEPPLSWGIYRNIPFLALGLLIIVLFFSEARRIRDRDLRFMWLAVALSFAFYLPVVLFSARAPAVGMLMIPKTLAYVWIVWMGFSGMRNQKRGYGSF